MLKILPEGAALKKTYSKLKIVQNSPQKWYNGIAQKTTNTKQERLFCMNDYTKFAWVMKREIFKFSKNICKGIGKPEEKLVINLLYGMAESGSCHLSKIARALKERILPKKVIERLSRGLRDFSTQEQQVLLDNYTQTVKKYTDKRTVFVVDGSDAVKPYSEKLEGLAMVRDGSTGKIEKGYFTLEVAALTSVTKTPLPVYDRVYSAGEADFISEDDEVFKGLRYVSKTFGRDGVRALDRGYDALVYYEYFLRAQEYFIIRATKNRRVCYKGETRNILEVAKLFKGKYRIDFKDKKGKPIYYEPKGCNTPPLGAVSEFPLRPAGRYRALDTPRSCRGEVHCKTTIIPVALPKYPNIPLNLVVVYGFGKDPMMLLTNLRSDDSRLANTVAKVYLMRWRIEEYFRFKKQPYRFEDFRVRKLNAIRTLHRVLSLLTGLIGMLSEKCEESLFAMQLIAVSKRIYRPKPEKAKCKFLHYAIADAFFAVLRRCSVGMQCFLAQIEPSSQLSFLVA